MNDLNTSKLQTFINDEFGQIRITLINNVPWFIAKDVSEKLGYSQTSNMIKRIDKEDFISSKLDGMNMKSLLINESGLYSAIIGSKLKSAKRFKHWVTSEVLPQIRKTGGYIPITTQDDDLTIMAKAHQILERTLHQKDILISTLQPKAEIYDMVMAADGTFSMNQLAKLVGIGEYKLFEFLRSQKVLFYQGADNVPYERFRSGGYFKVIDTTSKDGKSHTVTRVTQKGVDYVCKLLRKNEVI